MLLLQGFIGFILQNIENDTQILTSLEKNNQKIANFGSTSNLRRFEVFSFYFRIVSCFSTFLAAQHLAVRLLSVGQIIAIKPTQPLVWTIHPSASASSQGREKVLWVDYFRLKLHLYLFQSHHNPIDPRDSRWTPMHKPSPRSTKSFDMAGIECSASGVKTCENKLF